MYVKSLIDHFVVTYNLLPIVISYKSLHDGDNLSDHSVLSVELSVNIEYAHEQINPAYVPQWKKATCDQINEHDEYKRMLDLRFI